GVIGYHIGIKLHDNGYKGCILVVKLESSYHFVSSALAMVRVRQQYMSAVNTRMEQYRLKVLQQFPQCQFRQRGYLFLATESNYEKLRHRYETRRSLAAECEMLDVAEIRRLVPNLRSDDLVGGLFGPNDGYVEPRATLRAFRTRAEELGAVYVSDEVRKIEKECVYA